MTNKSLLTAVLTSSVFASAALAQGNPCGYEPNIGSPLGLSDDSLATGLQLGFTFTFPDGSQSTTIDVDSNGRLGATLASHDLSESVAELLSNPTTICPYWDDLNPNGTNADDVYFNALPGKAVITWKDIVEYAGSSPFTVQCTLWGDGRVTFSYDNRVPATNDALVGMSPGNGAADPGPVDFSARPFPSGMMTVYEDFRSGFDLMDQGIEFIPTGTDWIVIIPSGCASATTVGAGCGGTEPASFYEIFDGSLTINDLANFGGLNANFLGNGYAVLPGASPIVTPTGAPLALADDATVQVTLPFTMPTQIGAITDVWVCSNGWVSFVATTSTSLGESASGLLSGETRIACIWDDLDPTSGGGVYAEVDPGNPNLFHITWDQVPEYAFGGGTGANTCQLTLDAGGGWQLKFGAMTMQDGMTGYSLGGGVRDPGATDLTALAGALIVGDDRPDLSLSSISRPVLGTTASTQTNDIPSGAIAAVHLIGLALIPSPGLDLTPLGAPGCFVFTSSDAAVPFSAANPTAQHSLVVPNLPTLAGQHLYLQSAVLMPGINNLGAITSNAVDWLIDAQ